MSRASHIRRPFGAFDNPPFRVGATQIKGIESNNEPNAQRESNENPDQRAWPGRFNNSGCSQARQLPQRPRLPNRGHTESASERSAATPARRPFPAPAGNQQPASSKVGDSFHALVAAATMRAICVMPIGAMVGPVPHRGTARRTPLCPLGHHAPRRLRHVRNEFGTKPHRIGRAGLTGLGCALSGSASHPHCANSNQ